MRKPIAILGCGPAGLLAAHACAMTKKPFVIISRERKSRLGGAQFLHQSIPEVAEDEPYNITIVAEGDAATYQQKVYGTSTQVSFVSFPKERITHQKAWNLILTYDRLWELYSGHIEEEEVNGAWLLEKKGKFKRILSTVPAPAICLSNVGMINEIHMFHSQRIWVLPENVNPSLADGAIHYDGTIDRSWYRQSKLFGVGGTEYPYHVRPPVHGNLVGAFKPLFTNCGCFPEVVRLGRHGQWKKGVLTHDAFNGAAEALR